MNRQYFLYSFILILLLGACAKISSPTGGPKDTEAPEVTQYTQQNKALQVPTDLGEIRMNFNELVKLKDAGQIVISPPMEKSPTFSPQGSAKKYVSVVFNEPLKENTTYSINFGQSIEDNNEGNKLKNFSYVFSTGNSLDSLQYEGNIRKINSFNYDDKTVVGLYKWDDNYADSTIFKQKPYYIARPDSLGNFKFQYLAEGDYAIIGLDDKNKNLKYDAGVDGLAFMKEKIHVPSTEKSQLITFVEAEKFALKTGSYEEWGKIRIEMKGNPEPKSIEVKSLDKAYENGMITYSPTHDSLYYWFKPATTDSLKESRDGEFQLAVARDGKWLDTLKIRKKINYRPKKIELKQTQLNDDLGIVEFISETPLIKVNSDLISVENKDKKPVNFTAIIDEKNPLRMVVDFPKKYENTYKITLKSNAITDFFDKNNDSLKTEVKIAAEQEYGNLKVMLKNAPTTHFWVQLMKDNKVYREVYTNQNIITFKALKSAYYTLKIKVDENENGQWDTGNYFAKKQPEPIYFNFEPTFIKPYWDIDVEWDVTKISRPPAKNAKTDGKSPKRSSTPRPES